jgi:hypothetical protein
MINDYFFEDEENLVDVFGEVETEEEQTERIEEEGEE